MIICKYIIYICIKLPLVELTYFFCQLLLNLLNTYRALVKTGNLSGFLKPKIGYRYFKPIFIPNYRLPVTMAIFQLT